MYNAFQHLCLCWWTQVLSALVLAGYNTLLLVTVQPCRYKETLYYYFQGEISKRTLSLYSGSEDPDQSVHQLWYILRGWLGVAKVSCILRHLGVQLILAYSWTRPAILVAGKGRRGIFLFLLFLHFHSCSSFFPVPLFHLHYYLFYLFSPFLWETKQNDPQGLTCR